MPLSYLQLILLITIPFQAFGKLTTDLRFILSGRKSLDPINPYGFGDESLDIFGMYYILDTSKPEQMCSVVPASDAAHLLRIDDNESFRHTGSQYLINVS